MKNLIIHPKDQSTTFLKPIYEEAENQIVVSVRSCPHEIQELMRYSDRVIMMGHGSPSGLFSIDLFRQQLGKWETYAIGKNEIEELKTSNQNIYIWCNADMFVEKHDLKGFYSGMFISEVGEAMCCKVKATQEMVDESNNVFSVIVGKYINLPVDMLYKQVMEEYGELAKTNPVAKYNHDRLRLR